MQFRRILVSAATVVAAGLVVLAPAALADDPKTAPMPPKAVPSLLNPDGTKSKEEGKRALEEARKRDGQPLVTPPAKPNVGPDGKRSGDQVGEKPAGAPETGGGGTADSSTTGTVLMVSGGAALAVGGAGFLLMRRRRVTAQA